MGPVKSLATAINDHTAAVRAKMNIPSHNCAGDCAADIYRRWQGTALGPVKPVLDERTELIRSIRSHLPFVALGHPDLAAEIARTMDRLEALDASAAPR